MTDRIDAALTQQEDSLLLHSLFDQPSLRRPTRHLQLFPLWKPENSQLAKQPAVVIVEREANRHCVSGLVCQRQKALTSRET